jgi:hypothetical protein
MLIYLHTNVTAQMPNIQNKYSRTPRKGNGTFENIYCVLNLAAHP